MDFKIIRLHSGQASLRCYHLLDSQGKLLLVADHGTPWLPDDSHHQVRFARADGHLVASLDLPWQTAENKNGLSFTRHAIILNHAVYAIITVYQTIPEGDEAEKRPFLVIEVEDQRWLVLNRRPEAFDYSLYAGVPDNLLVYDELLESELPPAIGRLLDVESGHIFTLTLPGGLLQETPLIALAMLFLLDRSQ